MFKPIKLSHSDEARVFWASDFHYNHIQPFIWRPRGFNSFQENDAAILNSLSVLRPTDTLIYLGDLALNSCVESVKSLLSRIPCNVIYINGNHESAVSTIYKENAIPSIFMGRECRNWNNVFFFGDYLEVIVNNQLITNFHYPIKVWNKINQGSWALCGHSHGNCEDSKESNLNSKLLDVGFDVFHGPVSFDVIKAIMDKKQITSFDHH
jgi:calcineurin-like phosphoesterase family protein